MDDYEHDMRTFSLYSVSAVLQVFFLRQRSNFFKTLEPSVLAELPRLATFIEDRSMNLSKNISTAAQHDRLQNP